jgi:hypothetical protein
MARLRQGSHPTGYVFLGQVILAMPVIRKPLATRRESIAQSARLGIIGAPKSETPPCRKSATGYRGMHQINTALGRPLTYSAVHQNLTKSIATCQHSVTLVLMNVFISWSGDRSKGIAEALRKWLKQVINALDPWLSVADIEKGARWRDEVASRLKNSDMGIICLTPGNLQSAWLLFEAGALSKAMDTARVCPLLIDLEPADVSGPLAQFQATRATKNEVRALVRTINSSLPVDARRGEAELEEAFDVWWPKLDEQLKLLPIETSPPQPKRPEREILEEILELVRDQNRGSVGDAFSDMPLERMIQRALLRTKGVDGVLVDRAMDGASLLLGIRFAEEVAIPQTSFTVPIFPTTEKTIQSSVGLIRKYIREVSKIEGGVRAAGKIDLFEGTSSRDHETPPF